MTTNTEIIATVRRIEGFDWERATLLDLDALRRDLAALGRWLTAFDARAAAALAREERRHPRPLASTVRKGLAP